MWLWEKWPNNIPHADYSTGALFFSFLKFKLESLMLLLFFCLLVCRCCNCRFFFDFINTFRFGASTVKVFSRHRMNYRIKRHQHIKKNIYMYPSIRLCRALWIVNQDYQNKMLKGRRQNDANTETATLVHSNRRNNSEAYWKRNGFFMYWNYVEINHVAKMSLGWKSHIAQGRWIIKNNTKK